MNLSDALAQHGIESRSEGHHHCRPGWLQIDCPYCATTGKWHMGVSTGNGFVNCWRCGRHRLYQVLLDLNVPKREAYRLVKGDIEFDTRVLPSEVKRGKLDLPKGLGPLLPAHEAYLRKRRYDPEEIVSRWGVKGIGIASDLQWRIWIPIHYHGEIVSWTTRSICDDGLRYRGAKAEQERMNAKDLLYGEDLCGSSIIIHEGPLDVWRTGPGSVATLGIDFSLPQVDRIARYSTRAICYDSSPEAQAQAAKLCSLLEMFAGSTYNVRLQAKDAGESRPQEIKRLRQRFLQ